MLARISSFYRIFCRSAGYWGAAGLLWLVLSCAVQQAVMDRQAESPGGYKLPANVTVRKTLSAVGGAGSVFFFVGFLIRSNRRKSAKQAS